MKERTMYHVIVEYTTNEVKDLYMDKETFFLLVQPQLEANIMIDNYRYENA